MSYAIGRELWLRGRPCLLYFKPTARCDLRCQLCNRWQAPGAAREELPLADVRVMLERFRRAGCAVLTLWGGEPTLRADLGEILAAAKELGFRTSMCSNCRRLAHQADAIVPHLDVLLCSLDGYGERHDELRGVPGLFDEVVAGIAAAARHPGCEVKIWATVQRRSLDQLAQLASLARELGVGIEFFPPAVIPGHNDALVPSPEEVSAAFGEIRRLKRDGWPIRNPDRALEIMQTGAPFRCNSGRLTIHVNHAGMVYSCEDAAARPLHEWGSYRELDLTALYSSAEFRRVAARLRDCGRCRLPCVVELSGNLAVALAGMLVKNLRR